MKLLVPLASAAVLAAVAGAPTTTYEPGSVTHDFYAEGAGPALERNVAEPPWVRQGVPAETTQPPVSALAGMAAGPRARGQGLGKVALVELKHPQQASSPITAAEASEMLLGDAQRFFDRNVPGAVTFTVERTAKHTLSFSPCEREGQADDAVRKALALPSDVRVIMLTRYGGASTTRCSYTGIAIMSQGNLPGYVLLNGTTSDEGGSKGFAQWQMRETLIHELGHSFFLPHAERFACQGGATPAGSRSCAPRLWPGMHDVMGYWGSSDDPLLVHARWSLGSVGAGELHHPASRQGAGRLWEEVAWPDREGGGWRGIKIEDRAGSYWLEYREGRSLARDPRAGWRPFTPGVVVHMQTAIGVPVNVSSYVDLRKPVQVDLTPASKWSAEGGPLEETPDMAADTLPVGRSWTTPGGTTITVTDQGEGWADVAWSGPGDRTPPEQERSAPSLVTPKGATVAPGATTRSPVHVLPPFASDTGVGVSVCALKGAPGRPSIFRSEEVDPAPTADWWEERAAVSRQTGRKLTVRGGSVMWGGPSPITPVTTGPRAGTAAVLSLAPGRYSLAWTCRDRAGNWSKPSPSITVSVAR